jgi:hypothetical protein
MRSFERELSTLLLLLLAIVCVPPGTAVRVFSRQDLHDFALATAAKHEASFTTAIKEVGFTTDGHHRGAMAHEMLLVAAVTAELKADVLIESGRAAGESALMVLSALRRIRSEMKQPPIQFHSIDWSKARWHFPADNRVALQRLALFPNVTLHDGNALHIVPQLVEELTQRGLRVVLFTDGPKGYAGQFLHREAIRNRHVVAQFIHDANYGYDVRAFLDSLMVGRISDMNRDRWPCRNEVFYSDDPTWRRSFGHLDTAFNKVQPPTNSNNKKCCLYAPPAPCYGNVTFSLSAIALVMRHAATRSSGCLVTPRPGAPVAPLPKPLCSLYTVDKHCPGGCNYANGMPHPW